MSSIFVCGICYFFPFSSLSSNRITIFGFLFYILTIFPSNPNLSPHHSAFFCPHNLFPSARSNNHCDTVSINKALCLHGLTTSQTVFIYSSSHLLVSLVIFALSIREDGTVQLARMQQIEFDVITHFQNRSCFV